jgi:hypothetical protein
VDRDIFLYSRESLRQIGQLDDAVARFDRSFHLLLDFIETDRQSMVSLRDAARRLNGDLAAVVKQHAILQPIPSAAAPDFKVWQATYESYAKWGDAADRLQSAVFEGRFGTGFAEEAQRLVDGANQQRKNAERASFRLFNSFGVTSGRGRLIRFIPTAPKLSADERNAILKYFESSLRVSGIQDREAHSYNAAVDANRGALSNPESVDVLVRASERLVTTANDMMKRQSQLTPLASTFAHYAAWTLMFSDYRHWAETQHTLFVVLSKGQTPDPRWVRALMATSERRRATAEAEGIKLLRAIRVTPREVEGFSALADAAIEQAARDADANS